MNVSVVIPAYNEEATIGRCIDALTKQNYSKISYEIIVVDDGSTDRTCGVVRRYKKVRLIAQRRGGPGKARNTGVKKAKGVYVLFTDADCTPGKNWIKEMTSGFKDDKIAAVQGTYRTKQHSVVARLAQYEIEDRHRRLGRSAMSIATGCAAVRRDVFLKLGGFATAEKGVFGEDTEFAYRLVEAGYRIAFAPSAFVYHSHPARLADYLKQKYGRGVMTGAFLLRRHGSKLAKDPYKGFRLITELGLSGLAIIFSVLYVVRITPLIFPATAFALWVLSKAPVTVYVWKKDARVALATTPLLMLRDVSMGLGLLAGLFSRLFK